MDLLKRRVLRLAPVVVLGGITVACNALVGVDFGEAHLGDAGSDGHAMSIPDAGTEKDAQKDTGRPDARDAHAVDAREHDAIADGSAEDVSDGAGSDGPPCTTSADPSVEPCLVSDRYGVFVAPAADGGSDANNGSQAAPFAPIANTVPSGLTSSGPISKALLS